MKSMHILRTIIFSVGVLLASCVSQFDTEQSPVATVPFSPLAIGPTLESATPPPTNESARTPTRITIPTLSEMEGIESFTYLIEEDVCELPCWLGVVPGQTDFTDVENNFSRFNAIAYTNISSQWSVIRVFFPNFESATFDIDTSVAFADDGRVSRILVAASTYKDKISNPDFNNPDFQRLLQRYFLSEVFVRHGIPEKIFLDTTQIAADTSGPYPFVIWVVYPQQGFLLRYQGLNSDIGANIRICPMQSRIEIKIWDREKSNYEEFIKDDRALGISTSLGPQPIEVVTEFDIESFVERFKNGDTNTCFDTPSSIWPPN